MEKVLQFKKMIFQLVGETKTVPTMHYLVKVAKQPIPVMRNAAMDVMRAVATQPGSWALTSLFGGSPETSEFWHYLKDRTTEFSKEGKDLKFALIHAIQQSPSLGLLSEEMQKQLAILIGQRGCPYCKYMAERHLEDEATVSYIRENFEVVNLNLFGAREVTDFDGRTMSERQFGRAYGVRLTPSILFLPERADGLAARPPADRPSIRMPGLMKQPEFLGMFRYVREKGYESASFKQWLTTQQG